ncbi:MAG: glucosaminidase domain-containing protein [Muribaculaceae bacterium]
MKALKTLIFTLILSAMALTGYAVNPYEEYIERYSALAVDHQNEYGIPASITLAQGLLESAAGRSRLASKGNNHFGIKCHKEWKGKTMLRDDDARDECFRVYSSVEESFADHSRFLRRDRYKRLFDLDVTDYQGWARGLRKCGYATDPNYAARLITIIERYSLYVFDTTEGRNVEETVAFIADHLVKSHPVRRSRGLHYVVATPGDTYSSIAKEFNIKKKKLMKFNDVKRDRDIKPWEEVYLEEKLDDAPQDVATATIGEGESFHSVSQRYGMKLDRLKELNPKAKDESGTRLRLRPQKEK